MSNTSFHVVDHGECRIGQWSLPELVGQEEFDEMSDRVLAAVDTSPVRGWVFDLTHALYLGSSFLGLLVNARQRILSAGGVLVLCGLSPELQDVLRTCSLERMFPIARTRDDALKLLREAR